MTITDDIVKGLRNPTPLYAVAGTADLAAEKLREVPGMLEKLREQAPGHFEKLRATDPKDVQQRVAEGARDAQSKFNETFSDLDLKDLKELRPDFRKIGESVQGLALQGVGRAAEYAVRTRETYDELAERGKDAVAKWRGETSQEEPAKGQAAEEPPSAAAPEAKAKPRSAKAGSASDSEAPKPAAPKKPAAQRRTTPKKPTE
ncbi:hypothetical protein [Streptomyces sp. CA2R106]|uniref:hypothetical protein n=1 Tax=Streptomyces sp. CA2R106 TaxID=3120153 RepID=UPI00300ABC8C